MKLPDDVRKRLESDFVFASKQMSEAPNLQTSLYFFSALYGACSRALNMAWSDELTLLHSVLAHSHTQMMGFVAGAAQGQPTVGVSDSLQKELAQVCGNLATMFAAGKTEESDLYPHLARIAELAYSTTGNGRYLHLKGQYEI